MTFNNIQLQYRLGTLFFVCLFSLFVCLFVFGYSDKVKVTGTVTYTDTGEAVEFGQVVFMGETEFGRAVIRNGKYSAGFAKDGEGLRPGTYIVASEQTPPLSPVFYLKDPITLVVNKSMTCDFTVERGERPYLPASDLTVQDSIPHLEKHGSATRLDPVAHDLILRYQAARIYRLNLRFSLCSL